MSGTSSSSLSAPNVPTSSTNTNIEQLQQQILQQQKMQRFVEKQMNESCVTKTIFAGIGGAGFGAVWGVLMSSLDTSPLYVPQARPLLGAGKEIIISPSKNLTFEEKFKVREHFKQMGSRTWFYAKAFSGVGLLFTAYECSIEKFRAKHDMYNVATAGCLAGGTLGVRAGPQAAAIGCAGFAAFSTLIEYILHK